MPRSLPDLAIESDLLARHPMVIGVDEVGRGALSGPVVVGAVALTRAVPQPSGVADSKQLSPRRRRELFAAILTWADRVAIGAATANEIDEVGLTVALRRAAHRAIAQLSPSGAAVILDGVSDYVGDAPGVVHVVTVAKADQHAASVAAASIIAKVRRDELMVHLGVLDERFGWSENKGYGSDEHRRAIARFGTTDRHRRSWSITAPQDSLFDQG